MFNFGELDIDAVLGRKMVGGVRRSLLIMFGFWILLMELRASSLVMFSQPYSLYCVYLKLQTSNRVLTPLKCRKTSIWYSDCASAQRETGMTQLTYLFFSVSISTMFLKDDETEIICNHLLTIVRNLLCFISLAISMWFTSSSDDYETPLALQNYVEINFRESKTEGEKLSSLVIVIGLE